MAVSCGRDVEALPVVDDFELREMTRGAKRDAHFRSAAMAHRIADSLTRDLEGVNALGKREPHRVRVMDRDVAADLFHDLNRIDQSAYRLL